MATAKLIYSLSDLEILTALPASTIIRMELEGLFPKRVYTSKQKYGWTSIAVNNWVSTLKPKYSRSCEPKVTTACQLYRHFDVEGNLLYVGISINPLQRLSEHKDASNWFPLISNITVEHYGTREEAMLAERKAIISERPIHNIIFNGREPV